MEEKAPEATLDDLRAMTAALHGLVVTLAGIIHDQGAPELEHRLRALRLQRQGMSLGTLETIDHRLADDVLRIQIETLEHVLRPHKP